MFAPQVAWMVASEFFEQGDIEKEKLNLKPIVSIAFENFKIVITTKLAVLKSTENTCIKV